MELVANTLEDLPNISAQLIEYAGANSIWSFYGDMGAGKTTLIKHLCRQLGVVDTVNSPTFSLVNEYLTKENKSVYHFDFYRIQTEQEALDIGLYEYLDSQHYCFIEWAEKVPALLNEACLKINITVDQHSQKRTIQIVTP